MKLFGKNVENEVVVVAEIGANHEGSLSKAKELITLAKEAGADAVKLQAGLVEDESRLIRTGGGFALGERDLMDLEAHARRRVAIPIFASVLSLKVLGLCDTLFPVMKIASGDNRNGELIESVARTGKPTLISLGQIDVGEINDTLGTFLRVEGHGPLIPLHCVSAYPVPLDQANISFLDDLAFIWDGPIGYSNHVIGPEACYAAVARGATVIEVHFTDQKEGREFRDHALSFNPKELKEFIPIARRIRRSLGCGGEKVQECER